MEKRTVLQIGARSKGGGSSMRRDMTWDGAVWRGMVRQLWYGTDTEYGQVTDRVRTYGYRANAMRQRENNGNRDGNGRRARGKKEGQATDRLATAGDGLAGHSSPGQVWHRPVARGPWPTRMALAWRHACAHASMSHHVMGFSSSWAMIEKTTLVRSRHFVVGLVGPASHSRRDSPDQACLPGWEVVIWPVK